MKQSILPPASLVRATLLVLIGSHWACSGESAFLSNRKSALPVAKAADEGARKISLGFRLAEADAGKGMHARGSLRVRAEVVRLSDGKPLTEAAARAWKVTLKNAAGAVLASSVAPGEIALSFDKPLPKETLTATFENPGEPMPGRAALDLLFDTEGIATAASWSTFASSEGGARLSWTFSEPAAVEPSESGVFACPDSRTAALLEKSYSEKGFSSAKEAGCTLVMPGAQAVSETSFVVTNGRVPFAVEGAGVGADVSFVFVVSDKAANRRVQRAVKAKSDSRTLVLESTSARKLRLSELNASIPLKIQTQDANGKRSLTPAEEQAAIVSLSVDGRGETESAFAAFFDLDEKALREGAQRVVVKVRSGEGKEALTSNELAFDVEVDTLPPVVSAPLVRVEGGQLESGASVTLQWRSSDASALGEQSIEWRKRGETQWNGLAKLEGEARSARLEWPAQSGKLGAAEFRLVAKDALGHEGTSPIAVWKEQFFNAAVLTKSVECFWCHTKIVGDVGGIFPTSPADPTVHGEAGREFQITGKFYSNVNFPGARMPQAIPEAQRVANYKNEALPIFPKDNAWPVINPADLRTKMTGLLKGRDPVAARTVAIDRSLTGNVVLVGTASDPIDVSGEIFIDGDLVIAGVYKGIGTIYAKNVFVANNLVARESPFPFPESEAAARSAARAAVDSKKDALYLVSLNDLVVGAPESMSSQGCNGWQSCPVSFPAPQDLANPYAWLPKARFQALGKRAEAPIIRNYKISDNSVLDVPFDGKTEVQPEKSVPDGRGGTRSVVDLSTDRTAMDVARVDAFLFAGRLVRARGYMNLTVNGGIMSPELDIITSISRAFYGKPPLEGYRYGDATKGEIAPINPVSGVPYERNEIRYDWRLRVGGPGLEVLKSYFDQ